MSSSGNRDGLIPHSLNPKSPSPPPPSLLFFYFWIRVAGMLIKVYSVVAFGSSLWEFQVLLQLWEELSSPAGVLGRHLHKCLDETYSRTLFWGCCETQKHAGCSRDPGSGSSATTAPRACLALLALPSPDCFLLRVHLPPRLMLISQQSLFQAPVASKTGYSSPQRKKILFLQEINQSIIYFDQALTAGTTRGGLASPWHQPQFSEHPFDS